MEIILCPVDLKPDTLNALEAAAKLASAHRVHLVLLHVFTKKEYEDALGDGDLDGIDAYQQSLQQSMGALCDTLREADPSLSCSAVIRHGSTISTILEEAAILKSFLIVMGSHGVHNITEAMDGNHPVKVIEQSPCPVLCVPEGVTFEVPAKVVYGSRMKQQDPDCLQRLITLLHPFNSSIDVVYVGEGTSTTRDKWLAHEKMIRSYVRYEKLRFHLFDWDDEPYQGLDEYMQQTGGALLVLLTHQRNYLQRLFEKSVFKQITYFSEYPLLVFLEDHLTSAED
ncbi:universal stress protein [Cesiribacter sp. SM1]|uniref:universal stress protein n=1 Tax=Cesiribacter sp. SM1 TaxID=2861196 RepID=UPI001CD1C39F|nr:universal stress protein [Cesiribacter sp. SM1]